MPKRKKIRPESSSLTQKSGIADRKEHSKVIPQKRSTKSIEEIYEYVELLRNYERKDPNLLKQMSDEYYNTSIDTESFLEKHEEHKELAEAIIAMKRFMR